MSLYITHPLANFFSKEIVVIDEFGDHVICVFNAVFIFFSFEDITKGRKGANVSQMFFCKRGKGGGIWGEYAIEGEGVGKKVVENDLRRKEKK